MMSLRKLGLEPERCRSGVFRSGVFGILGGESFSKFRAVRTPGKVIWCNFDLARQLGFAVPRTNQLTPDFHAELLAALSLRSAPLAEDQETITMYADRYGGEGVRPALGAGRAGFLPYGNLYVKGVGFTPLFKHDDPDDFAHSHGGVHLDDCLSEAVFGEVNENLFARGSTRVLAIIDQGRHVTAPSGRRIPVALVVRAGAQLRPAHLLGRHWQSERSRLETFVNMARATGQLIMRHDHKTRVDVPDLRATMMRIIDDHARTAAEGFRWRMIHGALSASNMEMSGAMLDLPTQSTQPRTAPIRSLDYVDSVFGREHTARAIQLTPVYRALIRHTPKAERERLNLRQLNLAKEMDKAYRRHEQIQLLGATGLKTAVAERMVRDSPQLAERFTDLIRQMCALKNPGSTCAWRSTAENVSVLDVFNLLKILPPHYFANPNANLTRSILRNLKPVFRGNRFHIAKKKAAVDLHTISFAELYAELMGASAKYAIEYYSDMTNMQASIIARAAFENRSLDSLYASELVRELRQAITDYRKTGNAEVIRKAVDQRIANSLRSVERLLTQGRSCRLRSGGLALQMRVIDGVNYSVRAWNDAAQTRRLHISLPVERKWHDYLTPLPHLSSLTAEQTRSLRYHFTTDCWKSSAELSARLTHEASDGLTIDFEDICVFPVVGRLEGVFYLRSSGKSGWRAAPQTMGFTFAIPDRQELLSLVEAG